MRTGVLLATYRGERFVAEQLLSILNQTQLPDVVVVTDDGSDDRTLEICEQLTRRARCKVVLLPHEHVGLSRSLSRGLDVLDADVIFFADQDDRWYANKVERVTAFLEHHPSVLVTFHDGDLIDLDGEQLDGSLWRRAGLSPREKGALCIGDAIPVLARWNPVTGAAMAVRRRFLDLALPLPEAILHDSWFGLMAAAQHGLRAQAEHLISYRLHGGNFQGLAPERRLDRLRQRRSREGLRRIEGTLFTTAADRLGSVVDSSVIAVLRRKASFCRFRDELPTDPIRRLGAIAKHVAANDYLRFTKQPVRSIGFDVFGGEQYVRNLHRSQHDEVPQ